MAYFDCSNELFNKNRHLNSLHSQQQNYDKLLHLKTELSLPIQAL